jgi:hypothetical protein
MPADTLERPRFVEGQYIGADDLDAIVAYHRARQAEHQLAAHTWGIASGLELIERPDPAGGIEVWLQPGYATDGYGRALIVRSAARLGIDQLRGRPSGNYRVWLNYRETPQQAIRPGYGVCPCDGDAFARAAEGYEILITGELRLDEREGGVQYGGALRADARLVRRILDPEGPFLCDASVPEQAAHPRGARARWLVPVGLVRWNEAQGRLVAMDDPGRKGSRLARRYIGTVAESLYAADGVLRLRRRLAQPPPGTADSEVEQTCARGAMRDTDVQLTDERPVFEDLVWVEGHLRLLGDARIWGGRIEFRDEQGGDGGRPLALRARANTLAPQAGGDLEVLLGSQADGSNRLVVGTLGAGGTVNGRFVVTSAGRVAIGTNQPAAGLSLDVRGPIGVPAGDARLRLLGSEIRDDANGRLLLSSGGSTIAMPDPADNVAIGVTDPAPGLKLDVRGAIGIPAGDARLRLLGSEMRDDGQGRLLLSSGGGTIATADPTDRVVIGALDPAPGLKLDVRGDLGRVDGPATLHLWASTVGDLGDGILRIRSGGATVAFDGADRIGIGTTAPDRAVTVQGAAGTYLNVRADNGVHEVLLGADGNGGIVSTMTNHDLQLRAGGNNTRVTVKADGRVGIGTAAPAALLHLNGAAVKPGGGAWGMSSDERLKTDIQPITGALDRLLRLRGVSFAWRDPERAEGRALRETGFLAGEVEAVFPDWVETGADGYRIVGVRGFEAMVVEALRELRAENAALRKRLEALEQQGRRDAPRRPGKRSGRANDAPS